MKDILSEISVSIEKWKKRVVKEKATYHIMNMFDYSIHNSVIAEGWCPRKALPEVRRRIKLERTSESQVESYCEILQTNETPPTYFESTKFSECFQDIVNAYGVPRYKEINPAVLTIITFPFLFAVMFGDAGHGLILLLASLLIVLFEKRLQKSWEANEILSMIFHGRYVLLLMGIFSVYTGMLYNEWFGLPLNLFGSGWVFAIEGASKFTKKTYPFGVDPAWFATENQLTYYNSLKMKLSVIFGVTQVHVLNFTNTYFRR